MGITTTYGVRLKNNFRKNHWKNYYENPILNKSSRYKLQNKTLWLLINK